MNAYYCENRRDWYLKNASVVDNMDDVELIRWAGLHSRDTNPIACDEAREAAAKANTAREELRLRRAHWADFRRRSGMVWGG